MDGEWPDLKAQITLTTHLSIDCLDGLHIIAQLVDVVGYRVSGRGRQEPKE